MPSGGHNKIHFTQELADKICKLVATRPYGLKKICRENRDIPNPDIIREWRYDNPSFAEAYTRAKIDRVEVLVDKMDDIDDGVEEAFYYDDKGVRHVDNGIVQFARSQKDDIRWMIGKLNRKMYGDKEQQEEQKKSSPWIFKTNSNKKEVK